MANVAPARTDTEIDVARALVWEFFGVVRQRYPELLETIADYIKEQDVAGELDRFSDVFLPPHGDCYLGFHEGEIVGICFIRPRGEGDGELNRMYVRESARGRGLGRSLCDAAINGARDLGYETLYLDGYHRFVEALPLYRSVGFEDYTAPNAFGGYDKRFVNMRMTLS